MTSVDQRRRDGEHHRPRRVLRERRPRSSVLPSEQRGARAAHADVDRRATACPARTCVRSVASGATISCICADDEPLERALRRRRSRRARRSASRSSSPLPCLRELHRGRARRQLEAVRLVAIELQDGLVAQGERRLVERRSRNDETRNTRFWSGRLRVEVAAGRRLLADRAGGGSPSVLCSERTSIRAGSSPYCFTSPAFSSTTRWISSDARLLVIDATSVSSASALTGSTSCQLVVGLLHPRGLAVGELDLHLLDVRRATTVADLRLGLGASAAGLLIDEVDVADQAGEDDAAGRA